MALMSGKVYSNTGAPNNADGVNGDIYMQLDGFKTTYRKELGSWVAVGSTLGAIPEFVSGVGAPSNSLGTDGQYYRETSSQNIYYKQAGAWSLVGNLLGASFGPLLEQAGIGKDLATSPNLINSGSLNTVIEPGEYFYTDAVTDTPSPFGLMKVWRENASVIYQLVQASVGGGRLYTRYSTDGGVTWVSWVGSASTDLATTTLAGLVEKATQAELNNGTANVWPDAATILNGLSFSATPNGYIKLPEFMGGFIIQWGQELVSHDIDGGNSPNESISFSFLFGFPNVCLIAVPTIISNEQTAASALIALQDCAAQIYGITQYGLKVLVQEWTAIAQDLRVGYIAIGY